MAHARLWPTADKPLNNELRWEGFVACYRMSEQPWHAQNHKGLLPYLWGLQYSHGVGHSSKRLICLLDIDGKFVESIWGWGTRLHRGFKCQGVENSGVKEPTRMGDTKQQWLESMQWTMAEQRDENSGLQEEDCGKWWLEKRWRGAEICRLQICIQTLTNSICIYCWESSKVVIKKTGSLLQYGYIYIKYI